MFIVIPALLLVALIFASLFCGVYVARCYAEMLNQSSTGLDRVRWPSDTFLDWLGTACQMLLVFVAVVSVTAILAGPLALAVEAQWIRIAIAVLGATFVWAGFPLVLCAFHHPQILVLLPQRPGALLRVFGMTAPLVIAAGAGLVMILRGNPGGPLLLALLGPAILIHARAWGRLIWLVLNESPVRRRKKRRLPPANKPEVSTAIRTSEPSSAPRPAEDVDGYSLEASDFEPEPGHLAEHYEIQRESERWQRMRAGEEIVDPFGEVESPRPWTALAPSKIFGVLLQEQTAIVCITLMIEIGIIYGIIGLISATFTI